MPTDPLTSLPQDVRRTLDRALKLRAYADVFGAFEDDPFFSKITAFTLQNLMIEDPDLADLEAHRETLIDFVKRLQGHRDAFQRCPWTRFPRDLAYSGVLAEMTAGETRVYMALLALCDARTLVTFASLDAIAEKAGRSPDTTSKNLTLLKKRGLIKRWCIRHPEARDEHHYLWFTRIVPETCCESAHDRNQLLGTAAMPKGV